MKQIRCTLKIELCQLNAPKLSLAILSIAALLLLIGCQTGNYALEQGRPEIASQAYAMQPLTPVLPSETATPTPQPWYKFETHQGAELTPVPQPAEQIDLGNDIKVWLLMGTEKEAPYSGRIMALHILFVNERLAKAAMVSVPSNLLVYLPDIGMRRLSNSLALGGMDLVSKTLAYNFGVRPDRFILVHPLEFQHFINYLGGLEVSVIFPIKDACGGIPSGLHALNGQRLLCYVSYISDNDEVDRARRQQQVLGLLLEKLVQEGRLAKLANYYATFETKMETDFTLNEMLGKIPFILRLGDSARIHYSLMGWDSLSPWMMDEKTKVQVLLPLQPASSGLFHAARKFAGEASPLSEIVLIYEAQATKAMAAWQQTAKAAASPTYSFGNSSGTPQPFVPTVNFSFPTQSVPGAYPIEGGGSDWSYSTPVFGTPYP
ncbi:MAG: LCP family protein [Anaerolineaceae bacterium]|nr:LCP family protein [Anaerolineaceae bacterium]